MGKLILSEEASSPNTPANGSAIIYPKTNGTLYYKNDAGYENTIGSAPFDYDNRFSNPNGTIDQRKAGANVTISSTTTTYCPDRWFSNGTGSAGTFTVQRETTAGEDNILITVGTADASLAAGDTYSIAQAIEGYNVADLRFGQSDAKTITLSFEVKSSITGTFPVSIRNSVPNRSYVSTFAVNVANTWEEKTITFIADTGGTWLYTSGVGLYFAIGLGFGSTYQVSSLNTWTAGNFLSHSSCTNFMATSSNTMRLRKFRLRPGTAIVPFQNRSFDEELAHCQRYFETNVQYGTAPADGIAQTNGQQNYIAIILTQNSTQYIIGQGIGFKVRKRSTPTLVAYRSNAVAGTNVWGYMIAGGSSFTAFTPTLLAGDTQLWVTKSAPALTDNTAIYLDGWWTADSDF